MSDKIKSVSSKKIAYYIHTLIVLLFTFGFGYLPPLGTITTQGMHAIGIFLGLLWGWSTVGLFWPSLLSFLAIAATGYQNLTAVNTSAFGAGIVVNILLIFPIITYYQQTGLSRYIAYWFVSRKFANGHPWILLFLLFFSMMLLSGFMTQPVPVILLGWTIVYEICALTGYEKKSKFAVAALAGVIVGATYGAILFPFDFLSQCYFGSAEKASGMTMSFAKYTSLSFVFGLIFILLFLFICRFLWRVDVQKLTSNGDLFSEHRTQKMSSECRNAFYLLIAFIALLTIPSFTPTDWLLTKILSGLGVPGVTMLCLIFLCIIRCKQTGEALYDVGKLMTQGINWDFMLMMMATVPIINILEDEGSGIVAQIATVLPSLLEGTTGYMTLVIVFIVFGIATQFAHNMILGLAFIPVVCTIVTAMGINPLVVGFGMGFLLQSAFVTPACAGQVALLYCNTEWADIKQVYAIFTMMAIVSLLFLCLIGLPIMMFVI